jgi:hypothetical protein
VRWARQGSEPDMAKFWQGSPDLVVAAQRVVWVRLDSYPAEEFEEYPIDWLWEVAEDVV